MRVVPTKSAVDLHEHINKHSLNSFNAVYYPYIFFALQVLQSSLYTQRKISFFFRLKKNINFFLD